MARALTLLEKLYLAAIIVVGVGWITAVPRYVGVSLIAAEWIGLLLGVGVAGALLKYPYCERFRIVDALLGVVALGCWLWMSVNYNDWIIDVSGYTADKFVPGIVAIVLLMEAMRKAAGLPITVLVWLLIAYGLFGYLLPSPIQAEQLPAPAFVMYVYADTNGIPGLVMTVVGTLVLAFVVLGRLMQVSGATKFFTDLALAGMGHKRGGPAKVAIVASSIFGTINGTAIGNIMSTGIVTIPLMKKSGFKAHFAAAIEAVASNGGQIAPPVMGATAFLIAEFLQLSYVEVVIAALVPALLYYVCLFVQVDAIAARHGLDGIDKSDLPDARSLLKTGWVFLLPLLVLIYLLFGRGFDPALSAMAAVATLYVLMSILRRRLVSLKEIAAMVVGGGENMLPLLMIAGGAGIVIGVMNITGLGFSLSIMLSQIGQNAGIFAMLVLTAAISIVLGMGMPTTAIYVVLSVVLAPAIVRMGVEPMAAHLFIFYFGLLSFLTPPVAIASFVAANLAGSGMWRTAFEGMKLATVAYLLPFLWCFNPALIMDGSPIEIIYAVGTALVGALMIAQGMQWTRLTVVRDLALGLTLFGGAVAVGGSTIWFGADSALNGLAGLAGIALLLVARRGAGARLGRMKADRALRR
ncbi:TRAP transporter permease [Candidatus Rariloculus sp.]|uniref:TRAP transporter permease n=1 Tax=Candidatus Rariloculus sp. TaxID=3101265 RepID=UPI003D0C8330